MNLCCEISISLFAMNVEFLRLPTPEVGNKNHRYTLRSPGKGEAQAVYLATAVSRQNAPCRVLHLSRRLSECGTIRGHAAVKHPQLPFVLLCKVRLSP
jgi:hypothetical protein